MKNNLELLMAQRNMSVKELTVMTGLTKPTIANLKAQKQKDPRLSTVIAICKALNCSFYELIGKEEVE